MAVVARTRGLRFYGPMNKDVIRERAERLLAKYRRQRFLRYLVLVIGVLLFCLTVALGVLWKPHPLTILPALLGAPLIGWAGGLGDQARETLEKIDRLETEADHVLLPSLTTPALRQLDSGAERDSNRTKRQARGGYSSHIVQTILTIIAGVIISGIAWWLGWN